jgi:hypothetical protein
LLGCLGRVAARTEGVAGSGCGGRGGDLVSVSWAEGEVRGRQGEK